MPDIYKDIDRQEVLDSVYPIRKKPAKASATPGPVVSQGASQTDPFNLIPEVEDIEDNTLFGQLGRDADAKAKETVEIVNQERAQARQQEFIPGAPNMPNAGVSPLTENLSEADEKKTRAELRAKEAIDAGVLPDQFTPKEWFQYLHPDDSSDAYENINTLEKSFGKGLDEDGYLDPFAIARPTRQSPFTFVDYGSMIRPSVKMTPEQIMAAKEIDGLNQKELQKVKEYIGAHQIAKAKQKRLELQTYADYLSASQEEHIPKEVLGAYQAISELAPKYQAGELTEEEAVVLQQSQELLSKLPENTKEHLETLPVAYDRLQQEMSEIDTKYPELGIVEKLNTEIQNSYDKWYHGFGEALRPINRAYPVALKSLLNVAKAGAEVLPTLGESLNSTYDAVAGGLFGDEEAQANTLRRSNAFVQPGTLMDATVQKRSITERTAKVNFEGSPLEIAFNDDGDVVGIYDKYGAQVHYPEEQQAKLEEQIETQGVFGESQKRLNESAAFNAVTDGIRDLAVTMLLSKGLGSVVGGSGGLATRVREGIPIMFQYTGRMAEEAIAQGLTPDEALLYAGAQVGMESGTEMMFPFIGTLTGTGFNAKKALRAFISDPSKLKALGRREFFDD